MVYKPQKRWNQAQFHKYTGRFESFIKHGRVKEEGFQKILQKSCTYRIADDSTPTT